VSTLLDEDEAPDLIRVHSHDPLELLEAVVMGLLLEGNAEVAADFIPTLLHRTEAQLERLVRLEEARRMGGVSAYQVWGPVFDDSELIAVRPSVLSYIASEFDPEPGDWLDTVLAGVDPRYLDVWDTRDPRHAFTKSAPDEADAWIGASDGHGVIPVVGSRRHEDGTCSVAAVWVTAEGDVGDGLLLPCLTLGERDQVLAEMCRVSGARFAAVPPEVAAWWVLESIARTTESGGDIPSSTCRAVRVLSRWKTSYYPPSVFRARSVTMNEARDVFERHARGATWSFTPLDYADAGILPCRDDEPFSSWLDDAVHRLDTQTRRVHLRRWCDFMAQWTTYARDGQAAGVFAALALELRQGMLGSMVAQVMVERSLRDPFGSPRS
jgi:hypothetical protein